MADLGALKDTFKNYKDTLKNTSFDRHNGEYLCQSDKEVINFDKLVGDDSKSFDALYFKDNQAKDVYCIEFKNQKPSKIKKKKKVKKDKTEEKKEDLKYKFVEGMKFLEECFKKENLQVKEYQFYFYVVVKFFEGRKLADYRRGVEKMTIMSSLRSAQKENPNVRILQRTKIKWGRVKDLKTNYEKIFETKCK